MATRGVLDNIAVVRVFVSSSSEDEALHLRERLRSLRDDLNESLWQANRRLMVRLEEWQAVTPHQIPDSTVTEEFASMATECSAVIALLIRELRPGTKAELDAVRKLDPGDVQLQTLVFPPGGDWAQLTRRLRRYLAKHSSTILFSDLGDYASVQAEKGLQQALYRIAFENLSDPVPFVEVRG